MKNKSIASIGVAMLAATAFIGCGDDSIEIKNTDVISQINNGVTTEEQVKANMQANADTYEELVEDVNANTKPEIIYESDLEQEEVEIKNITNPNIDIPSIDEFCEAREIDGKVYHIMPVNNTCIAKFSDRADRLEDKGITVDDKDELEARMFSGNQFRNRENLDFGLFNVNWKGLNTIIYQSPNTNSQVVAEKGTLWLDTDTLVMEQCADNGMLHVKYHDEDGSIKEGWVENNGYIRVANTQYTEAKDIYDSQEQSFIDCYGKTILENSYTPYATTEKDITE